MQSGNFLHILFKQTTVFYYNNSNQTEYQNIASLVFL